MLFCHLWPVRLNNNFFPTLSQKGTILGGGGGGLLNIKCVFRFSLQILSEIFLILRRIERDMIQIVYRSSCEVPVVVLRFYWHLSFIDIFSKNTQVSNLMKSHTCRNRVVPCGQRDRQTDITKLIAVFRNLKIPPDNSTRHLTWYCMDSVSSCNIYVIQQDTQCFMIEFIHNTWWLDMFRTSIVRLQESVQAVWLCLQAVWLCLQAVWLCLQAVWLCLQAV